MSCCCPVSETQKVSGSSLFQGLSFYARKCELGFRAGLGVWEVALIQLCQLVILPDDSCTQHTLTHETHGMRDTRFGNDFSPSDVLRPLELRVESIDCVEKSVLPGLIV